MLFLLNKIRGSGTEADRRRRECSSVMNASESVRRLWKRSWLQYGPEDDFDTDINLLKPEEIHKILDDYVIGQRMQKALSSWQFIIIIKLPQQEIGMWSFRKAIF